MTDTSQISKSNNTRHILHKDGDTMDIISSILWADSQPAHAHDTKKFAPQFIRSTTPETLQAVWRFVKSNIKYVLDPLGEQYIKAPSRTWSDRFADCKSRSLFITSILKNLRIPYTYRFASYSGGYPYQHVYVVVKPSTDPSSWFILDPDMPRFNVQKQIPNNYFKDYDMSKIEYLAGLPKPKRIIKKIKSKRGKLRMYLPLHKMKDTDIELAIRKQREEINHAIIEGIGGIGCPHAEKVQDRIDAYEDIIEVRKSKMSEDDQIAAIHGIVDDYFDGKYDVSSVVAGIGDIGKKKAARQQKKAERKAERKAVNQKVKDAKKSGDKGALKAAKKGRRQFVKKKITAGLKKVGKGILKAATFAQRLALKGVIEIMLPKIAPLFLYLFIKDQAIIDKLPAKARKKRKTSEKLARFITKSIGMKEDHMMGIIRNGIMKRYKKSPEALLSKSLGTGVNGIGDIGYVQIIAMALKIIGKIFKLLKGKKNKDDGDLEGELKENGEPDLLQDFADATENTKKELASAIMKQEVTTAMKAATDPGYSAPSSEAAQDEDGDGSKSPESSASIDTGEAKKEIETGDTSAPADEAPKPLNSRKSQVC